MDRTSLVWKYLAGGVILLFLGNCIIPAIAQNTENPLSTSRGNWLYVGGDGPGNYTKIQDAIDNASNGDTIFVFHGFYVENISINKSLALLGEQRKTTVIDGAELGTVVTIQADDVTLCNFTIQNAVDPYGGYGYGIKVEANHTCIKNNILGPKNSVGLYLYKAHNNTITRNRFLYNGDAIFLIGSNDNLFFENTIGYSSVYGFYIVEARNNNIHNNNFIFNLFFCRCFGSTIEDMNNSWNGNYWNVPRYSPKPILVRTGPFKLSFQYDRNPAVIPYGNVTTEQSIYTNLIFTIKGRVDGVFNCSPWDGTGVKIGRLPMLGIVLNNSMRGGKLKYNGNAVNFSFGFGGTTFLYTTFELEDAVGLFYHQKTPLLPTFAPHFRAFCFVKKLTKTTYHFTYT
ncbi:MAG: NosD domain-containing protein [Candidatus Thermoplasmatota archaeon]